MSEGSVGVWSRAEAQFDDTKADGQYRKPASNDKLLRSLRDTQTDFSFTPFRQGESCLSSSRR